jgi:amino acid transporter
MDTKSRASGLKKKRKIFAWLFLGSILVFIASGILFTWAPKSGMPQRPLSKTYRAPQGGKTARLSPPQPLAEGPSKSAPGMGVVSIVSLLTSIASLIGLCSTTVLAWRKEKREGLTAELEIKKRELELEKLRAELAKSEKSRNSESS